MTKQELEKEIEQVASDWNLFDRGRFTRHDEMAITSQLVEIAEKSTKTKEDLIELIDTMTCKKCPLYGKSHEDDDGVNKVRNASYCCAWDFFKDWVRDK